MGIQRACSDSELRKMCIRDRNEATAEYWIPGAFSNETASRVLEGTKKVVNDSNAVSYTHLDVYKRQA